MMMILDVVCQVSVAEVVSKVDLKGDDDECVGSQKAREESWRGNLL